MRMIDADRLEDLLMQEPGDGVYLHRSAILHIIDNMATAETPPSGGVTGWVCPVCGRGLSPYTAVCPCRNGKGWEPTCG